MNQYDIIVIGTGSGGGTITKELAETGKKILVLERGGFIPKEKENWDPHEVVTVGRYRPDEFWYDVDNKPFKPFIHYNVGGNSKAYGAAMFRFREADFQETRHYGGLSPAWPIGYNILEPYYTKAESMYTVHGKRGEDPTEPPASGDYPFPPLTDEPFTKQLRNKLRLIGLKPFSLPMGLKLPQDTHSNRSPVSLANFDGFPDPTDSKSDAQVRALEPALQYPNVQLLTNAYVKRLNTDSFGSKISEVVVELDGSEVMFSTGIVIVACGAVNSAALFLRSANNHHPNGLANSSGMVGRNLMLHHNGCLVGFGVKNNDSRFQKSFGIADYYFGAEDSEFPLGEIQLMGRNDPDTMMWLAEKIAPGKSYAELVPETIDFWLTAEDLPVPENRVVLTSGGQIKVHYRKTNFEAYERLKQKLIDIFRRLGDIDEQYKGIQWNGYDLDISGMSHQNGTLRFGNDPTNSVLDIHCKTHELDNLFVVDASFFPSCGAFNPSLTIAANAIRVADHIKACLL